MSNQDLVEATEDELLVDGYRVLATLPIAHGPEWTVFIAITDKSSYVLECGVNKDGQYFNVLSQHLELEDYIKSMVSGDLLNS